MWAHGFGMDVERVFAAERDAGKLRVGGNHRGGAARRMAADRNDFYVCKRRCKYLQHRFPSRARRRNASGFGGGGAGNRARRLDRRSRCGATVGFARSRSARAIAAALNCGGAIATLPVSDTVKWSDASGDFIESTLQRARVHLAQTPQVFARTTFESALRQAARDQFQGTDCASLVERAHDENGELHRVALVAGEANNFKITFAADLARATQILDEKHQGEQWQEQ